eukprot:3691876-Rhodomonas_salina.4
MPRCATFQHIPVGIVKSIPEPVLCIFFPFPTITCAAVRLTAKYPATMEAASTLMVEKLVGYPGYRPLSAIPSLRDSLLHLVCP